MQAKLDIGIIYLTNISIYFKNQRTDLIKEFEAGSIEVQVEGQQGENVCVRGKYPDDAYFATVNINHLYAK